MPGQHERGRFIHRENRFVARIELADGQQVRAYLPNTARLHDVLQPGAAVVIRPATAPHRRTAWTLTRVWDGTWVALEASHAASLVADHLVEDGGPPGWPRVLEVHREVRVGPHRVDLELVLGDGERALVEVKSLSRAQDRVAPLSATPSTRGVSQLGQLARLARDGRRVGVVFVVQRGDVDVLDLTTAADPTWRSAVDEARRAGVHVLAYRCTVTATSAWLDRPLPIRDRPAEQLAAVYLDSLVEVELPSGQVVTLRAEGDNAVSGRLPAELTAIGGRFHVLTACNPYSAPLPARINAARNHLLAVALEDAGLQHLPAQASAPDGTWREPGFAVVDADPARVLELARRFEQHAVYELANGQLAVHWTDRERSPDRRGIQRIAPETPTNGP